MGKDKKTDYQDCRVVWFTVLEAAIQSADEKQATQAMRELSRLVLKSNRYRNQTSPKRIPEPVRKTNRKLLQSILSRNQ